MASIPDKKVVGEFIDAAVQDPDKAARMLREYPGLKEARWILDETLLHFLTIESYTEGVRMCCQLGFNPNLTDANGNTALMDAVALGRTEIAAILLEHGADPNAESPARDCMLTCAVQKGNAAMADLLLSAGARVHYITEAELSIFEALPNDLEGRQAVEAVLAKHGIQRPF